MSEENVFDNIEEDALEKTEEKTEKKEKEEQKDDEKKMVFGDFVESEPAEIILADEDKDKVFEIESAEIQKPFTKDSDGVPIEPKVTSNNRKYYQSKLKIKYKDSDYVSFVPNVKWFLNVDDDNNVRLTPWFNRTIKEDELEDNFMPTISKLYYRYCEFTNQEPGKVQNKEFIDGLVGKKVKLEQYKSKNPITNKMGHRIDIKEFV